jgi:hypothetical protein
MFKVTNILSAMQPLYCVSKLFGLTPYSYRELLNNSYVIKGPSASITIWTLIVTIFIVAGYIHNLVYFFQHNKYHTASSSIVITFEKTWLFAFSVSILLLGLTRNRLKIQNILQHILEIEQNILKNKAGNIYKKEFCSLLLQIVFVSVFHVFILYSNVTIHTDKDDFACQFSYIIASFVNTLGVIQFLFLLKILRWSCKNIGDDLEHAKIKYLKTSNIFTVRNIHDNPQSQQLSTKLQHLRSLHFKLYKLAELINSCYGFLMLIETAHNFVMLVGLMHRILIATEKKIDTNLVTYNICLLIFYSAKATMILRTSQLTQNKSKEILVIVHKLLLCPNVDQECETQLRLFAAQIVDNKFEFTACGIFPLDLSTLHSIVAAAATYIIILYQMRNM